MSVQAYSGDEFEPIAPAKKQFVIRAASDGFRVGLSAAFFPDAAEVMKELGFSWFPLRRMWVIPATKMKAAISLLPKYASKYREWDFSDMRDKALTAWNSPADDFFVSLFDTQLMPLDSGGFACTAVFDSLYVQVMRDLNGVFHKYAGAWEVKAPIQLIKRKLLDQVGIGEQYLFVHESSVNLEQLVSAPKAGVPISVAGAAPEFVHGVDKTSEGMGSGFITTFGTPLERWPVNEDLLQKTAANCSLRDYQVVGVRHLIGHSSALLADDMGLGKTRQAVVAAHLASGEDHILVVCPASLCINWEREIHALFPDDKVAFIGQHSMQKCKEARWIVANYERLGGLVRDPSIRIGVMLIDECHYLKEHEAGRTRNAFILADRVPRRFLLTGTPVLNREVEIHTLLRLSGHPIGRMPLQEFKKTYAGDAAKRAELADRLKEWMLRRGKDALKDLGVKHHQVRIIEPAEGMGAYEAIVKDMTMQAMPKITKLRQCLEMMKLDFIIESIQCLPEGEKAIVFCEYMETVGHLMQALKESGIGAVSLVGADSTTKRMKAVDALQQDKGTRVFVGTTMAAGVGITLTAANYVFFASLPWTNALKRQAEDRAYRSGNTRDVFVIIPVVAKTIDEQVNALLSAKEVIEKDLVESVRRAIAA
ncbi:DEAD/DEAH box helicase [Aquabacterium sp. NJ1]|uniref:DEAD/DEAH box helicase n=1 Tax=Aquabacterium sp. NJ1 TaxID=1538295 RepID=UPI000A4AD96B|nr:DEAD/DEAH box helicase [Aquabacterium sp. NJ1]